jgi:hypothetical protein
VLRQEGRGYHVVLGEQKYIRQVKGRSGSSLVLGLFLLGTDKAIEVGMWWEVGGGKILRAVLS